MVEPVAVEGDREWSEEQLLLPDLNNAADRDWRLNFDSFQLSELKEKPPPRGLHHSCLGVLRPEDNVAGYYQQQVEMLEGFNEMDALAQRGFLIGMSKEDKEKLARSETTAIRLSNVANMILFAAKVYASVRSGSLAIIASTLDSLLDLLSGFILWFTAFSMQTPNPYQYPIGKKRMQPLGILVFASVMATLGLQIILESVRTLISEDSEFNLTDEQERLVVGIMLSVTLVKLFLVVYCRSFTNEIVKAYAQDHFFDVITNIIGLIAALLAKYNSDWMDPVGAIIARKALRALKGLVRLQAIIRGRAVRRQAIITLKCLQSIVSFQSQVSAKKLQMVEGTWNTFHENKELKGFNFKDNLIKIDSNSQRRWDDSILSKDEANGMFLSKRQAAIKRERIKEYSLSQRRSTESEHNKVNGRWRYWLEQWVDTQLSKNSDMVFPSNARIREQHGGQFKPRNSQKQYYKEELDPPISAPKRSFVHKKQLSVGDDNDFASSPVVPTYMAATESAKAKARSMSSPRLRGVNLDAYSDTNSPYKHKLSPISSVNLGGFQQRSPCLKRRPGPLKSNRNLKDLSFDSECSLPNWDQNGASFR